MAKLDYAYEVDGPTANDVMQDNMLAFRVGPIVPVKKIKVLMVDMGPLCDLPSTGLGSTVFVEDGVYRVRTQEHPDGDTYMVSWHLIVRPLIAPTTKGVYVDAYCVAEDKLEGMLGEPLAGDLRNYLVDRDPDAYQRIRPLLDDLSEAGLSYRACWSKPDHRRAVLVTDQLLNDQRLIDAGLSDGKQLHVHEPWGSDCFAVAGDALIVEDEATGAGYRIEAKAFQDTYQIC